jgi:hypothetical protein
MLKDKIIKKESGILLYGITPPKAHNAPEKIREISLKTTERLQRLNIDGLVIYDLQDESSRNPNERPFPFFSTVDSDIYANEYLGNLDVPKVIYKSVGKISKPRLSGWIDEIQNSKNTSVFVGVPSKQQHVEMRLNEAYELWKDVNKSNILGAVTIPERHQTSRSEHLKIISKMENGCSYFISQCVYNIEFVKNVLSDLQLYCKDNNVEFPMMIFTLTTCGSKKTLDFMDWLGIHLPIWLRNELFHSQDILNKSLELSFTIAKEITDFCIAKNIPFGMNIESVSIRKEEIEASENLLKRVERLFQKKGLRAKTPYPRLVFAE